MTKYYIVDGNKPLLQIGISNLISNNLPNLKLLSTPDYKISLLLILCIDSLSNSQKYLLKYQDYSNLHTLILYSEADNNLNLSTYLINCSCILKDSISFQDLLNCLQLIEHNIFFSDKNIFSHLKQQLKSYNSLNTSLSQLNIKHKPTYKELTIAKFILCGLDNKAIAHELNLSFGTIKNTISLILEKYNFHNRSQIISLLFFQ